MKHLMFSLLALCAAGNLAAQKPDTVYYDQHWQPTIRLNRPFYYAIRTKVSLPGGYSVGIRYFNGGPLMTGNVADTGYRGRQGTFVWYFRNGQKQQQAYYRQGRVTGIFLRYYPDGRLRTVGRYNDGVRDSTWREYMPDSSVFGQETYDNGALIWRDTATPHARMERFLEGRKLVCDDISTDRLSGGQFRLLCPVKATRAAPDTSATPQLTAGEYLGSPDSIYTSILIWKDVSFSPDGTWIATVTTIMEADSQYLDPVTLRGLDAALGYLKRTYKFTRLPMMLLVENPAGMTIECAEPGNPNVQLVFDMRGKFLRRKK